MCRQYGTEARDVLQIAKLRGWCTQESLTEYLNAGLSRAAQEPISRATVANWWLGRAFMRFLEHVTPHTAEALNLLAGRVACRAEEVPTTEEDVATTIRRLERSTNDLDRVIDDVTDPEGHGGSAVTDQEWSELGPTLDRTRAHLDRLDAKRPRRQVPLTAQRGGR
jgi:hypothetical protein